MTFSYIILRLLCDCEDYNHLFTTTFSLGTTSSVVRTPDFHWHGKPLIIACDSTVLAFSHCLNRDQTADVINEYCLLNKNTKTAELTLVLCNEHFELWVS